MIYRAVKDDMWAVQAQEDGTWYLYRIDRDKACITRQEWLELRSRVDAFFEATTDAEINLYNREMRERYEDRYCEEAKAVASQDRQPRSGYVYLLHGTGTDWYKIGQSINPSVRLKQLGTRAPFPIETVGVYGASDMDAEELYWHERFRSKRVEGEWFVLTKDDVSAFLRLCEEDGI